MLTFWGTVTYHFNNRIEGQLCCNDRFNAVLNYINKQDGLYEHFSEDIVGRCYVKQFGQIVIVEK